MVGSTPQGDRSWDSAVFGLGVITCATETLSVLGLELGEGDFLQESLLLITSTFILSRPFLNWPCQIQAKDATELSPAF